MQYRVHDMHSRKRMTVAQAEKKFPVGAKVKFFPLSGEQHFEEAEVRSEPWALGHGQVVVLITGRSGGVAVEHLIPSSNQEQAA